MNNNLDTNRSFLYGDGFFDTLLLDSPVCKNYDIHFIRNITSAKLLKMLWKSEWTPTYFTNLINDIYLKNGEKMLKVRFTFFRNSTGGYSPDNNEMAFSIKVESYLNILLKPLKTGVFKDATKQCNFYSGIKSTSSILYVTAALKMQELNLDEIIILNEYGRICESLNSNFYLKKDNVFYTPPLSEGCVDGTYRTQMLRGDFGLNVIEKIINIKELNEGEIYFSNAVKGLTSGVLV